MSRKLYKKPIKKFICSPKEYWIRVTYAYSRSVDVSLYYEKDPKIAIHTQNVLLDDYDDDDAKKIVKTFCTYFPKRYSSHSDLRLRDAAKSISSVYTSLGLKIWRRPRTNPYA